MRIAVLLPRGMNFSAAHATAIDLCAWDFVRYSRFREDTMIIGEAAGPPLEGVHFSPVGAKEARIPALCRSADRHHPDLIVVHQHLPTAHAVRRRFMKVPLVYHRHNYERERPNPFRRFLKSRQYSSPDRIIFVSESVRSHFLEFWPEHEPKSRVIHNGLPVLEWRPEPKRLCEVVFVGRAVPEKGALEAAQAVRDALENLPDWTASFLLAGINENPSYSARVIEIIRACGSRVAVRTNVPFMEVKRSFERAAIALVPSIWSEPFGRTAVEAHAGGAALISSGRGGLREISGDAALYVTPTDPRAISEAIRLLADDAPRREALAAAGRERAENCFNIADKAAMLDDQLEALARRTSR